MEQGLCSVPSAPTLGMLVYVFQEGHGFEDWMNFTPLSVDPTTPVIMFCIVFGLSMDYEVLMLSIQIAEHAVAPRLSLDGLVLIT